MGTCIFFNKIIDGKYMRLLMTFIISSLKITMWFDIYRHYNFTTLKYKFWKNISEIKFQILISINQKHMNAAPGSKTKLYLQFMASRWRPRCVCIHKSGDHWAKDTVDYSVFVTRLTTANLHNADSDSGLIRFYCFLWR